ncbi:hypothetical protein MKW94_009133 [Papaver nudicaule]|uniref:3'-5' exonuclease domain-containing protein n=1 Tax=Papaver nudicaule TaxID=74823 RepID=A0AA41VTZ4_PAPNU|nr:hypothetical protein [Papaver nudicaule]
MTTNGVSIRELPNLRPDTQEFYTVTVNGEKITTVVTKHSPTVDDWIEKIYTDYKDCIDAVKKEDDLRRFIVGFDVKWKPNFGDDDHPIATLTLCVYRKCLIFQIMRAVEVPRSLHRFLGDENLRFVGVGIEDAALKLEGEYNTRVEKTVDLGDSAAERYGKKELKTLGLMELAKFLSNWGQKWYALRMEEIEVPANVTGSNWGQKFLTREQIQYASADAYVSFQIGDYLHPCLWMRGNGASYLALWDSCSEKCAEKILKDTRETRRRLSKY